MGESFLLSLLIMASGIFLTIGAIADWGIIMQSRRAGLLVGLLGYETTRIVYAILGVIIIVVSFLAMI